MATPRRPRRPHRPAAEAWRPLPRLETRDSALLLAVATVFGVCFFLHLNVLIRGPLAWIPLHVGAGAGQEDPPIVRGLWASETAHASGLEPGDRLLAVGDTTLRGVGPLGFAARVYREAGGDARVAVRYARGGEEHVAALDLLVVPYPWRTAFVSLAFATAGALTFWRARGSRASRVFFLAVAAYALHWSYFWGGPLPQTIAAVGVFLVASSLALPFTLRTILVFPEESARAGRWAALWPWAFACGGVFVTTWAFGWPLPPASGQALGVGASVAFIAVALFELARSYRRCGPRGRRQLRWVLLGFYLGLAPAALAGVVAVAAPGLWWLYETSLTAVVAIPLCLFIAISRYNLFDVDRLITAAASYSLLSIAVLGATLGLFPRVVTALEGVADPTVTQVVLSLGLAGAIVPLAARVQGLVQRLLFVERHALEGGARDLREALADCVEPGELLTVFGERLERLLRPESLVIYGRTGEGFAPVFARGRAVPPGFDGAGPLAARLSNQRDPVYVHDLRLPTAALASAERAALDALGVDVVLPLSLRGRLAAFTCLGEKHSGDVYTATDLVLLQGISDKARDELARFDQAEVYRQERELHERLRPYVPAALAELAITGGGLDEGVRAVTVLFADLRGYTAFAEGAGAAAAHALKARYAALVSGILEAHGGFLVDIAGDGVLGAFGAHRALPDKERAALRAARAILARVSELAGDGPAARSGGPLLQAGIGIATGSAFVGTVRAADRLIFTVTGDTINLASRLQGLTRELDAALVADAATCRAAPDEAADLTPRSGLAIRGRDVRVDVRVLERGTVPPAASIGGALLRGSDAAPEQGPSCAPASSPLRSE